MDVILSIADDVLERARRKAEVMGTTVDRLVQEYLTQLSGKSTPEEVAAEFERLSFMTHGNSRGWKFDREESHERR